MLGTLPGVYVVEHPNRALRLVGRVDQAAGDAHPERFAAAPLAANLGLVGPSVVDQRVRLGADALPILGGVVEHLARLADHLLARVAEHLREASVDALGDAVADERDARGHAFENQFLLLERSLERDLRFAQAGDVGADRDDAAGARAADAGEHPAPVADAIHARLLARFGFAAPDPLRHPGVDVAGELRLDGLALGDREPHELGEALADELRRIVERGLRLRVLAVAQHHAVFGVVDRDRLWKAFDGVAERILRLAQPVDQALVHDPGADGVGQRAMEFAAHA